MTIKQVEPLKFKGNKTWYLHKLSEKGAAAMKCDFPNGDDTFTETTLQAAIEELAANGGGGSSSPSAQPDRVIVIDTTLEEAIPGKAYATFAAAQEYMETYSEQRFCVELPAGAYNQQVTLSSQWLVKGNKTELGLAVKSKEKIDLATLAGGGLTLPVCPILMEGCTVNAGFSKEGAEGSNAPYFFLNNCRILNATVPEATTETVFVVATNCDIDSASASPAYVMPGNSIVRSLAAGGVFAFNSQIFGTVSASVGMELYNNCVLNSATVAGNFKNCVFLTGVTLGDANMYVCSGDFSVAGTKYMISTSNVRIQAAEGVSTAQETYQCENSQIRMRRANSHSSSRILLFSSMLHLWADFPTVHADVHSKVYLDKESGAATITTLGKLEAAGGTEVVILVDELSAPVATITTNCRPNNIMYSTDGGTTMSDDPTSATYVGVLIDPTADYNSTPVPGQYVWIPLS